MKVLRQIGGGLIYGLVSVVLVVGGLSLALGESYTLAHPTATLGLPPIPQTLTSTQPGLAAPPTETPPPTATPPPPVNCAPPTGWSPVLVQPGDTLASVAARYNTTPDQLAQGNCLLTQNIAPGYTLYAPTLPATAFQCGPLPGWINAYIVQPGDTIYHIAHLYSTTTTNMMIANCKTSSLIFSGERLWVPNVPTITPGVTIIPIFPTETEVPTEPLTFTPLPFTATIIPTNTYDPPPSSTLVTPSATITPFPTTKP
ncbi:MAG TPA: LysM peptidoglycan-binding domain-containing protein [Anaerolineales bacterium]|nr:LysM peptidoglycan-binding domain-containing protein [Anaerolineales bacterium]